MSYSIGQAAKLLGIAPSTLRFYDKEGLLPFMERNKNGVRIFKESDMEWLFTIECLKQTGMPIKDIKTFIDWCIEGDSTIAQRLELIKNQQRSVMKQREHLKKHLGLLNYKQWYYETALEHGSCSVHDGIKEEDVPEQFRPYISSKNSLRNKQAVCK